MTPLPRPAPRRRSRSTRLALAVAVLGLAGPALPVHAAPSRPAALGSAVAAPTATEGACTDGTGVTVIIDFQELGGGAYTRCTGSAPRSGFDALQLAGISYQTTVRFPGFLCKIAGKPANDPCRDASPADAYWSYWLAPRGGRWCYSNFGAGNRTPPPGTVEGWSFSLDKTASATPPPGLAPPAPAPGVTPTAIPGRDCTVPTTGATTTTRPPATSPPTSPPTTNPSSPGGGSGGGSGGGPGGGGIGGSGRGGGSGGPPAPGGPTTTTEPRPGSTTTAKPGASTTSTRAGAAVDGSGGDQPDGDGESAAASRDRSRRAGGSREATAANREGDVDLGSDGQPASSPVPVVVGLVLVAGLAAAAVRASRRNRSASAPS